MLICSNTIEDAVKMVDVLSFNNVIKFMCYPIVVNHLSHVICVVVSIHHISISKLNNLTFYA